MMQKIKPLRLEKYRIYPAFILFIIIFVLLQGCLSTGPQLVIIGYVGGYKGLVNTNLIAATKLTHIDYAFADIKNNRALLRWERTDTVNLRNLNLLKKQNPALKVLISIGGWTWSRNFSDAVLTDTSRQAFAGSAVDIIKKYDLDGIDIDWEYPGRPGFEGNIYRPQDKQNYTLMFKELRKQMDTLARQTGKKYLLTTAAGAFKSFLDNTQMDKAQRYLDFINLMTYDYSGGRIASHHTALYASKFYKAQNNADNAVKLFIAAGVPANKLIIGMAFYGKISILTPGAKGLGDSVVAFKKNIGYSVIKDSILKVGEVKHYRDKHARAPYTYNAKTREFITYDDEWSVKNKCEYAKSKKLGGVMFWEYAEDPKGYLLNETNKVLR